MITWKEKRLVPILDTIRVADGYKDICSECENWGEACETCDVSIPMECEYEWIEVTMAQMTLCGIPVGYPYRIDEFD